MQPVAIAQIDELLQVLSSEKLQLVYDFVSYLVVREQARTGLSNDSRASQTMLASEAALQRDWDRPEEDAAWAHL